jgi:hypothetical protein
MAVRPWQAKPCRRAAFEGVHGGAQSNFRSRGRSRYRHRLLRIRADDVSTKSDPDPDPDIRRIRAAVRGKPKPRLLGVVDYLRIQPLCYQAYDDTKESNHTGAATEFRHPAHPYYQGCPFHPSMDLPGPSNQYSLPFMILWNLGPRWIAWNNNGLLTILKLHGL